MILLHTILWDVYIVTYKILLYTLLLIQVDETGLYVTELKDHMIIQQEGEDQIYNEEDVVLSIPSEETVSEIDPVVEDSQVK